MPSIVTNDGIDMVNRILAADKTLKQHLSEVMGKCGYVQFDGQAPITAGGYQYASAEAVFSKVRKELSERGICVSGDSFLEHFSVADKVSHAVVKSLLTFHLGDEALSVSAHGEGKTVGGKSIAVATTAANKYAVAKLLLMSWGDDPEREDDSVPEVVQSWIAKCEEAARISSSASDFASWWETYGDAVKEDCTKEHAAEVYAVYRSLLKKKGGTK